jgi:RimJ/RimL family protein N-acetyltransferase
VTNPLQTVRQYPIERTDGLRKEPRVELRPLREADESVYCSLYTDADTMALIGPPLSPERAARSFHTALRRTADPTDSFRCFAVVERATRIAIGLCGQQPIDVAGRRAEIGIMLTRHARERGHSAGAFALLIDVTFAALPIDTVWVQYHPANAAAERMCDRLGFEPYAEGIRDTDSAIVRRVLRSTWNRTDNVNNQGKTNVERDPFS